MNKPKRLDSSLCGLRLCPSTRPRLWSMNAPKRRRRPNAPSRNGPHACVSQTGGARPRAGEALNAMASACELCLIPRRCQSAVSAGLVIRVAPL